MGQLYDQATNVTKEESFAAQDSFERQAAGEVERGAWENLFVSMERSFYNIVDLSATSIRKLSTFALEDDDVRKQTGAGWVGKNAGTLALRAGRKAADPTLAPETDPETMDKFAELLGTTIPYTAAAIAGGAIGGVAGGVVGAGTAGLRIGATLASFASMREGAYRNAIDTGADEGTANTEANIVGGIQALLEMAQIGGILRQSKTGGVLLKSIVLNARNKAWTQVLKAGGQLSMSMVRTMTEEALQEALQGTTAELVPKLLRGKEIEPGFLGRRAREAAGGALIGGIFGGIGSMAEIATGRGQAAHIPSRPEIEFDPTVEQQTGREVKEQGAKDELDIINKYLSEHDASKGTVPASNIDQTGRDKEFARKVSEGKESGKQSFLFPDDLEHAEDAIRIGERLGYSPEDIAAYLQKNYIDQKITEQDALTEQTSDIPSEGGIEFSEEVAEGETVSDANIADKIIEGQEEEVIVKDLSEPDTRTDGEVSIDRLNEALENRVLGEARKLTDIERSLELGERVGKAEAKRKKLIEEGMSVDAAQQEAMGELEGEMPKAKFPLFTSEEMTPMDFENIRSAVINKGLQFFEETHALAAINKLQDGIVPTESEMKDLGKVIGEKNVDAMITIAKGRSKLHSFLVNLINFPTTTLASSEVSFIARQGLTTLTKWPKQWLSALNASYRSYFSNEWADVMQKDIQTRPNHQFRTSVGVDFLELDTTDLTKREERHMSEWAKQIPLFGALVKASERAAVVGMNKLRADIFDHVSEQWKGFDYPTSEYKKLAEIVNMSTGRGNITNKKVEAILPFLNAFLFSPRYGASRFEMVGKGTKSLVNVVAGKATPSQKILASELVNFVIAGGLAVTLAAMMGAKVERDPQSSDFGKIVMGRTRIDVWAGFQQIARSTAQIITGKGKAVSSGEIFTKNRLETFGRFIQSKLSPVAGLGIELLSGKDFLGEPIPTFENKTDLAEWALYKKLAPLVLQDTVDAIKYSQNKGAAALAFPLAFHGVGVQTYETNALDDLTQMRDHYSTRVFGKEWKNLGPLSQEALREYKPQIVEQEGIAKFERRNASFDVKRQREAGVTVEKSLSREVRNEMDRVFVSLSGLSRTITRDWRLNADLYKKYQDDLSFLLNKILPRIISKPGYKSQSPQVRQKILKSIIKEAKAAVRKNIVLKANMKDLQDIREGVEDD